uniref:Uncharacterized protein n=1 Tax=Oryza rufipogon TaxID=4529 RepID=A0A0E0PZG0_ORYRU
MRSWRKDTTLTSGLLECDKESLAEEANRSCPSRYCDLGEDWKTLELGWESWIHKHELGRCKIGLAVGKRCFGSYLNQDGNIFKATNYFPTIIPGEQCTIGQMSEN